MKIGFVGQGFVGKNYADLIEERGYAVVRYSLEEPFRSNKELIRECKISIIGVPTPTTPGGFDDSHVRDALSVIAEGNTAVIKSTIAPGTTVQLQKSFPLITVLYSPEFLSESTAAQDVANPFANLVGLPMHDEMHEQAAKEYLMLLPDAPHTEVMSSTEAEIFKYIHNASGYVQIVFFNMLYDFAMKQGADWAPIERAIKSDPFVPSRYSQPVHKKGRGAGGNCFVKDFATFRRAFRMALPEELKSNSVFDALENKNIDLLRKSGKDTVIVRGVYGDLV